MPGPDVAWQLWIAHQIRLGARLYVDIVETNPPLWFWEAVPLDWAAALLRVPSHVLLVAATGFAAAVSVWSTGRLLRPMPAPWRAALLVYAALTLLLMPLIDTGQREQFALIGALPYLALAAARREGRTVNPLFAAAIGATACFGFALKHYFLIVPVLIELWLLIEQRRTYRPFRPETLAVAAMGVLYAIAVATITPRFLTHVIALDHIVYAKVAKASLADMIRPIQVYWLLALLPLILRPAMVRRTPLAAALAIGALGFALGWLIQSKGFPYHSIPASGCLMLALGVVLVENRRRLGFLTVVTAPTLLLLPLGFTAWYGPYRNDFAPIVQPMLRGVGPRESVAFVSYEAVFSWPLALYRDALYPSRQYGMWILRPVVEDRGRTPALAHIGRQVVAETAQDYRCAQPVRIIFNRRTIAGVDLESYFLAQPSFTDLLRHYRRLGTYRQFAIYQINAHFPPPPASTCRRNF